MPTVENEVKRFSGTGATTGTGLTDILEVILGEEGYKDLWFQVVNTGVNLTGFSLLGKVHTDGAYVTLLTTTGWDSVAGLLKFVSGTIKTLANAATGHAYVDIGPLYAIKFQASVGSSTTSVAIKGGLTR